MHSGGGLMKETQEWPLLMQSDEYAALAAPQNAKLRLLGNRYGRVTTATRE
jgi:hypothetical protein